MRILLKMRLTKHTVWDTDSSTLVRNCPVISANGKAGEYAASHVFIIPWLARAMVQGSTGLSGLDMSSVTSLHTRQVDSSCQDLASTLVSAMYLQCFLCTFSQCSCWHCLEQ